MSQRVVSAYVGRVLTQTRILCPTIETLLSTRSGVVGVGLRVCRNLVMQKGDGAGLRGSEGKTIVIFLGGVFRIETLSQILYMARH